MGDPRSADHGTAQLLGEDLDADFQLSNVMLYWLTGTAASAGRLYYENAHAADRPSEPTTVPIGLAGFGGDFSGIRRFAERDHGNIVSWNMYPSGGHFAAHKAPSSSAMSGRSIVGSAEGAEAAAAGPWPPIPARAPNLGARAGAYRPRGKRRVIAGRRCPWLGSRP